MSNGDEKGLKRFDGESDDAGKQLKKWKAWAQAKMASMKDFGAKQQGPWVYTLLDGKALEAVEHLTLEDLMKESGAQAIWQLLAERFPEKETADQMGEALGEVFGLSAKEGESMQLWTSRVQECFLRCQRKAGVEFPAAAQGWIALHCSGLSEEQRAIVKAKSQGKLELAAISSALRSCFPQYRASARAKKPMTPALAVEAEAEGDEAADEDNFPDVEAFLADHSFHEEPATMELDETEAAEALAASWREKRVEINRFRQARQFNQMNSAKKSYRIEIEELKKRTRCRKCGKLGHWARECRQGGSGKFRAGEGNAATSTAAGSHDVNYVQAEDVVEEQISFVGAVEFSNEEIGEPFPTEVLSSGLISSPGYGVVDSGCGRTLIGRRTLEQFTKLIEGKTSYQPQEYEARSCFRFGNGSVEDSYRAVKIPVGIGGRMGTIDAAIIKGQAPLLLGRPTLQKLKVVLDFGAKQMRFLDHQEPVPTHCNQAGQLLIHLLSFPKASRSARVTQESKGTVAEAMSAMSAMTTTAAAASEGDTSVSALCLQPSPVAIPENPEDPESPDHPESPKLVDPVPTSEQDHVVPPPEPHKNLKTCQRRHKRTLKAKECRCLLAQLDRQESAIAVAELFCPPRLAAKARQMGGTGLSFDIRQGCDLLNPVTQQEVDATLDEFPPELLLCCPPCTHWGGWDFLNRQRRSPLERAKLIRTARLQVKFCLQQIHKQLKRGKHFMFEHPVGSAVWKLPEMQNLKRKYGFHRVDMCAYGLKCPDSNKPIRKGTGIICSNKNFASAVRTCTCVEPHQVAEGSVSGGRSRCALAAEYTPQFVDAVWRHVGPQTEVLTTVEHSEIAWQELGVECLAGEPEAVGEEAPDEESPAEAEKRKKIDQALRKLHNNLGHPSQRELIRVLKHSGASELTLQQASKLACPVCANHQRPGAALPANTSRIVEFNAKVGLDVKYLPGWSPNQKVACVNLVDYATSLQVVVPLGRKETGELLLTALRDRWVSWAGPPCTLVLDPARPNVGEVLSEFCNNQGINVEQTATEAHWQLGKVERHGQWFQQILNRVLDDIKPTTEEEWKNCVVQTQSAKNSLLAEAGASPFQLVYGRNPRVPTDLLQESPHPAAVDAIELDDVAGKAHVVRQAARRSMLECQDDKALRAALRARPRVVRAFKSGDWVYYWRTQKWVNGVKLEGGRWYGAAMVLGEIGKNLVIAHKRSIMRCAPEQLRPATPQEQVVAEFPQNELLGIRMLLEKGQFPRSQFEDLVPKEMPPQALEPELSVEAPANAPAMTAAEIRQQQLQDVRPQSVSDAAVPTMASDATVAPSYGPVRPSSHRLWRKTPLTTLHRPATEQADDFADMMQELVPRLLQSLPLDHEPGSASTDVPLPSRKRAASKDLPHPSVPPAARLLPEDRGSGAVSSTASDLPLPSTPDNASQPAGADDARASDVEEEVLWAEVLSCEHLYSSRAEALMAAFLQKRMQKEIPASGNEPDMQAKVEQAKQIEWDTVSGKQAVKVWTGAKAREIRQNYSHRFVGSRFVVTNKTDEEGSRIKARICLQGHSDPDVDEKIKSGLCHSPTLSQLGRAVLLQLMVSNHWTLNLGDIKGAFLEAGELPPKFRPLYAHQPEGGIPGVPRDAVIEVTGNLYGANDAPFQWYNTFDLAAKEVGFRKSAFDNCLYYLHSPDGMLIGALGAHVDDTMTGGRGPIYDEAIRKLRQRFPYRKWRVGNGEFCGVMYSQDPHTFEVNYQQSEYARHLRPVVLSRERKADREAPASEKEIKALRAINGAANWLSSQSRPDLAVQTSFSQQAFPEPKVSDLVFANQLVHRARQHASVSVTVRDIPMDKLAIAFHSDAGFANTGSNKTQTQAGYVLAFVSQELNNDKESPWSPFSWRSYKMSRVVASTLAGEAQAFSTACGTAEWVSLMLLEARHGSIDLREPKGMRPPIIGITDCKSLYDAANTVSSPSKLEDKRVAIDLAIIRQAVDRTQMCIRWAPTELMLADSLTKDSADPADLLRAALHQGTYHLSPEAAVLAEKKVQRAERARRREQQPQEA